ncbi:MAG TPA: hypothetical protein VJO99_07110 [Burkholderiaceae bacterium]|nr:hypothetical protein [Burkholderiaceae bacterium]
MWVVYDHPLDWPSHFVGRLHEVHTSGASVPTRQIVLSDTLDGVRRKLPFGLTCIPRHPNDDPNIVEVWL